MIGSIRGTLLAREPDGTVVVEAAGVGYELHVTGPTSAALGELGTDVFLRVHTKVREDAITLFGFAGNEEKRCFEALLGAHGVGPSMALAILAMHSPSELRQIVAMEDAVALARTPGVGKKTAARLLIELKNKFDIDLDAHMIDVTGPTAAVGAVTPRADVIAALNELGYEGNEIRRVVKELPEDGPVEELLRAALRKMAEAS